MIYGGDSISVYNNNEIEELRHQALDIQGLVAKLLKILHPPKTS